MWFAFGASVSLLTDIHSNLTLGPSLMFVCLDPASPCLVPWLASIFGREASPALPSPAALLGEDPITDLRFEPFSSLAPLADATHFLAWVGAGGSMAQEHGDQKWHLKHLTRPQFSLSYLAPASPSYWSLHLRPPKSLTLIFVVKFSEPRSLKAVLIYVLWLT